MKYYQVSRSFIKTILYFDIFSYPLLEKEVISYCDLPGIDPLTGRRVLEYLVRKDLIRYAGGFYFVGPDHSIVNKRMEENRRADRRMKAARISARIISGFPYVRAVFISGSLSKHVMKKDSDIDYFIITEPGRLWFCRTLLTAFKKIILGNSHRNFCLNYFVDANSLSIPERNLYTATEIAFLLPLYNHLLYRRFMRANSWYQYEYPNMKESDELLRIKPSKLKYLIEFAFDNPAGNAIDKLCYGVITRFWKRKYRYLEEKKFSMNIFAAKNVSRFHPYSWQQGVLDTLEYKIRDFELATGFILSDADPVIQTSASL